MPTYPTLQSADDAVQQTGVAASIATTSLELDSDGTATNSGPWVGLRFQNVQIAPGATVVTATITVQVGKSDDPAVDIYGQAADNAAAFAANVNDISGRARTAAKVDWDGTNVTANSPETTPNIAAIIQEIVNRPGWQSGNSIVIIMQGMSPTTLVDFYAWDDATNPDPFLTVTSLKPAAAPAAVGIAANPATTTSVPFGTVANAGTAGVSMVANDPQVKVDVPAGTAGVSMVANNPQATTAVVGAAQVAAVGIAANNVASILVAPTAQPAAVTIAAPTIAPEVGYPPLPVPPPVVYLPTTAVSDRFRIAVTESHHRVNRVHLHRLSNPDPFMEFPIYDGQVVITARDEVKRSADILIATDDAGREIAPDVAGDIFEPLHTEIQVWSGVEYVDASQELVPVALLKVTDYEMVPESGGRLHRLTCMDRSVRFRQDFGSVFVVPAGTPVERAIEAMAQHAVATIPVHLPRMGFVTPSLTYAENDDVWASMVKLARSAGYELTMSRLGVLIANPIVLQPKQQPDWTIPEGSRDIARDFGRSLASEDMPNHIIVESSRTGSTVRGEAFDNDPTSPTWVNGPHGHVRRTIPDPHVTSTAMANIAAAAYLVRILAKAELNTADLVPNPAMDADETVHAQRPSSGLDKSLLIDKLTMPLTVDGEWMPAEFRRSVKTDQDLFSLAAP